MKDTGEYLHHASHETEERCEQREGSVHRAEQFVKESRYHHISCDAEEVGYQRNPEKRLVGKYVGGRGSCVCWNRKPFANRVGEGGSRIEQVEDAGHSPLEAGRR